MAEWQALMDPATDFAVAGLKLHWWQEEIRRWADGHALHPITRFLAPFAASRATDVRPLARCIDAAAAQVAGAPLEHAAELSSHADALYGIPLAIAASLAGTPGDRSDVRLSLAALGAAEYLARAIAGFAGEARAGRTAFAVDELLAAGIENADFLAPEPPPRLANYLHRLRRDAHRHYASAGAALGADVRPALRHVLVLAALGDNHLRAGTLPQGADFRLADLYNAWTAARRAAAAR